MPSIGIFLIALASAPTNSDVGAATYMAVLQAVPLCKAELDNPAPHRAQFFKAHTRTAADALTAMLICDAWTHGFVEGTRKAKDPDYKVGFNGE